MAASTDAVFIKSWRIRVAEEKFNSSCMVHNLWASFIRGTKQSKQPKQAKKKKKLNYKNDHHDQ